ncbi:hypothetical protein HHK36_010039 [Tetracentron sinense]|uniref:Uncharacterized protein n=1 Tax=Tetracentron sinense TaxID=13715 RepID=A0A834ZK32_TETSI|nr:hypothetical protein HHK36_010039 [Tetracentron sinense]
MFHLRQSSNQQLHLGGCCVIGLQLCGTITIHPPSISTRVRSRWFSTVEAWITVVHGEIDQSGHIVTAATACFSSAEIQRHHRFLQASALRVLQVFKWFWLSSDPAVHVPFGF